MELPPRLASALFTLTGALDELEAVVVRRSERGAPPGEADRDLAPLRAERDALLAERSADAGRIATLLGANDEVSVRLQRIAAVLRTMADRGNSSDSDAGQG